VATQRRFADHLATVVAARQRVLVHHHVLGQVPEDVKSAVALGDLAAVVSGHLDAMAVGRLGLVAPDELLSVAHDGDRLVFFTNRR
jgi:hypothetical protein